MPWQLYSVPVYFGLTDTTEHFEVEAPGEDTAIAAAVIAAVEKYGPQCHSSIRERPRVIVRPDVSVLASV